MKGAFSPLWDHSYVVPTKPVELGTFEFHFQQRRHSPVIRATYDGQALPLEPVVYAARLYGTSTLQAVDAGMARPEDLTGKDLRGKLAVVTRESTPFSYLKSAELIAAVADAGAKAVILVNDKPGPFATTVPKSTGTAIPAWSLTQDEGAVLFGRMADGPTQIVLKGITGVPQVYNIATMVPGGIPADPVDAVTAENSAVVKSHYRSTKGTLIGDANLAFRPNDSLVRRRPGLLRRAGGPGGVVLHRQQAADDGGVAVVAQRLPGPHRHLPQCEGRNPHLPAGRAARADLAGRGERPGRNGGHPGGP
jgi:hypothetical protein